MAVREKTTSGLDSSVPNHSPPNAHTVVVPVNSDSPPLDISLLCRARLKDGPIPTSTTYNIKVFNELHRELVLDVAGERKIYKNFLKILVLGPCADRQV